MDVPSDEAVRRRWKWFVAFGVVIAILGLVALGNVADATLVTVIFVGWLLVLGGIAQIIGAFTSGGSAGWRILAGILGLLYLVVGFDIIADPLGGAIALTLVIAIVLIVEGVIHLFSAFSGGTPNRGLVGVIGVIDILLGVWLWTGIPMSGLAIGFFVGLQLLMAGILWIIAGWMARSLTSAPAPQSAS
jgi:uncharacterized membrane protein HdeD (DUF308 family)